MTFNKKIPGLKDFLDYAYNLRWYLLVIVAVFAICMAIGYSIGMTLPSLTGNTISDLKDQVGTLKETSSLGFMLGIFENNVIKCLSGHSRAGRRRGAAGVHHCQWVRRRHRRRLRHRAIRTVICTGRDAASRSHRDAHGLPLGCHRAEAGLGRAAVTLPGRVPAACPKPIDLWKDIKEGLLIYVFWVAPLLLVAAFLETFVTGTLLYLLFSH